MKFKAARLALLSALAKNGWICSSGLKVDHARSPAGDVVVIFKAQSIHFAPIEGNESLSSAMKHAHSLFVGPRHLTTAELIDMANRCAYRAADHRSPEL